MEAKIKALLEEIDPINDAEDEEYGDRDLEEMGDSKPIDSEKIKAKMRELSERLGEAPKKKQYRERLSTASGSATRNETRH